MHKLFLSPCECPTPCERFEVIMNPHLSEIAYILDRSGSMQPMQEPAVAASPTQRPKLSAYHDIHHRMVQWQQKHDTK